ncbi:alkaline shock response membrane anchor protein AmaP [Streptomyces sp. NPDC001380]|uniref:alkaline shock response membrane anchor protein AmaP n=1 Tax=Streptomyces sp. NPDC001380 TaxID=3364566 RepID=UPI003698914C
MKVQAAVNRILLALAGLVLLGGGLLVLAGGLDLLPGTEDGRLPGPHDVLLGRARRTRFTGEGWWWPAVIAGLALAVVLAVWWLTAQPGPRTAGRLVLGGPKPPEGVELRGQALGDAVAAQAAGLPGVRRAGVRPVGRPDRPRARIALTLAPDGEPAAVLRALCEGPLADARTSAGWASLPADVRLRVAGHRTRRAE